MTIDNCYSECCEEREWERVIEWAKREKMMSGQ